MATKSTGGEVYVDNIRLEPVVSSAKNYASTFTSTELASPTRAGYTFVGWYNDGQYTTKLSTSNTLTTSTANFASVGTSSTNAYIYAKWTRNNYTITYNLNGGTNPSGAATSYTVESPTITLPTPTKSGATFAGWYTSSGLTGTAVTKITQGSTGNKTYYAKWS